MSLEEIRSKLIDLYLCVKVRKSDEIKNITSEYIQNERNSLKIKIYHKMFAIKL